MPTTEPDPLQAWSSIVREVQRLVDGATDEQLDRRRSAGEMTLRETVHHLVEGQVVAASIVVAALGSPGCVYDWSWMMPFGPWMERLRYDLKPLGPALQLLASLEAWVVSQLAPLPDGLQRTVQLRDAPDASLRTVTVADVLRQEVAHLAEHIDVRDSSR